MRIKKDEYNNLIDQLKSIFETQSISEKELFYKIAEYIEALLNYHYSVNLEHDKPDIKVNGSVVGLNVIKELQEIENTENIELEATHSKALIELEAIIKQLSKLLEDESNPTIKNELNYLTKVLANEIPIRENKAILVHNKILELIRIIINITPKVNLESIIDFSDDIKLNNTDDYQKFLERFKHWRIKKDVKAWEAFRVLSLIAMVIDNDVDNRERLKKIGADPLIIEDNQILSNEVYSILKDEPLNNRTQLPEAIEIRRMFELFHRYIIFRLRNMLLNLEDEVLINNNSSILKFGKLQINESMCMLAWDNVWYKNIPIGKKSVGMLILLLKNPELVIEYKTIIKEVDIKDKFSQPAELTQQYKSQLMEDLTQAQIPKDIAISIRNMIQTVRSKGYRITSN